MINKRTVFVGPSSGSKDIFCGWDIQPPAKAGDLVNYVMQNSSVEVLVVVDGYFFEEFAILHREIKEVIESGYTVIGCSSMGALRAVEMQSCGMIGFGDVYSYYIENPSTGDDEVGLLHELNEAGYRHLSIPLINLRILAEKVEDRELKDHLDLLVSYLSTLSFGERDWKRIEEYMDRVAGSASKDVVRVLKEEYIDYKSIDLEMTIREAELLVLPQRNAQYITQAEIDRSVESIRSGKSAIDDFVLAPYVYIDTRDSELDGLTLSTQSVRDLTILDTNLHADVMKEQLYRQLLLAEGIRNDITVISSDLNQFISDLIQRRDWGSLSGAYKKTYLVRSAFIRYAIREYIVDTMEGLLLTSQGNSFAISSYLDSIRTLSSIDEIMQRKSIIRLAMLLYKSISRLGISITRKIIKQTLEVQKLEARESGCKKVMNPTRTDLEEILDRWTKTCRD